MSTDFDLSFLVETFDAAPDPSALAGVLFADDFDLEPPPAAVATAAAAEPAPQMHDEAALHAARLDGFTQGQTATRDEHSARLAAAAEAMTATLSHALAGAAASAHEVASASAEGLAADILRTLAAALPELCARHGAAEAGALADALLPMLRQQPRIVLRVNPHTLPALQDCIARHRGDAPDRISVVPTDALAEGDISLEWQDGAATRDSAGLCRDLAAMLTPLGIGPAAPTHPDGSMHQGGPTLQAPPQHQGDARHGVIERELADAE